MIPRQLSPGDNPQFIIFPPGFRLRYRWSSYSALTMNTDNKLTASGCSQKSETFELTGVIKTELLKIQESNTSISCEFIPEIPFPWNGAFLEWQKQLRNRTRHEI